MTPALPSATGYPGPMPPTPVLDLAVDAAAAYRLTRLVTTDAITQPARDAVADRWPGSHLDTLINCPWCTGVWVAAGVQAAALLAPRWWRPTARGLALAAIAGVAGSRL